MIKIDVFITKIPLDASISLTSISEQREYIHYENTLHKTFEKVLKKHLKQLKGV